MSAEKWILGADNGALLFEKLMGVLKQFDFYNLVRLRDSNLRPNMLFTKGF
jgi:hypothetical protein